MSDEFSAGVDLEEVERFREIDVASRLARRLFRPEELEETSASLEPAKVMCAKFAAKEAVMKALGGLGVQAFYDEISIGHRGNGAPQATIHGGSAANIQISLSVSHTKGFTIAFAIAMRSGDHHERIADGHVKGDFP